MESWPKSDKPKPRGFKPIMLLFQFCNEGSTNFRSSAVEDHARSETHLRAVRATQQQNPNVSAKDTTNVINTHAICNFTCTYSLHIGRHVERHVDGWFRKTASRRKWKKIIRALSKTLWTSTRRRWCPAPPSWTELVPQWPPSTMPPPPTSLLTSPLKPKRSNLNRTLRAHRVQTPREPTVRPSTPSTPLR